ncbi:MAG: hypothetical protein JWM88_269 [Verrucomicrobia bacterium]|nr:hypothetical protein [Verrucomicrobiota bacterium]
MGINPPDRAPASRRELASVPAVQPDMSRPFLPPLILAVAAAAGFSVRADEPTEPPLLHEAVGNWTAGKEDLAFTQRGRTLDDDGKLKEERVERYDPSLPDAQRWHLIEVNGKPPTDAQRESIEHRRNRKPRKKANKPPEELLDFSKARVATETAKDVTFEVPLRSESARMVQTEKLILLITVGRETRMIERVTAGLRDTMRVALGLAKITDVDFDLTLDGIDEGEKSTKGHPKAPPKPQEEDQVTGTARVALTKFGERMEYEWSDFKRVNAYHAPAKPGAAAADGK